MIYKIDNLSNINTILILLNFFEDFISLYHLSYQCRINHVCMCPTHVVDTLLLELAKELNHGISLLLDPKIEIGP
jgi:hypothetical protein